MIIIFIGNKSNAKCDQNMNKLIDGLSACRAYIFNFQSLLKFNYKMSSTNAKVAYENLLMPQVLSMEFRC